MLASHAWLMQLTGLDADPAEVARSFTQAGIEVEQTRSFGDGLAHVVVAEVRGMRAHPKRDKLRLVTVFDGSAEHEVVCGAPNVPPSGERVVLAQLGAVLPGGIEVAPRDLGGIVSSGMLCSARELDAGSDELGIIVLGTDDRFSPGQLAVDALALRDTVYELSLTPNRADCLGHVGLARELCALFDKPFALPKPPLPARIASAPPTLFAQREAVCSLGMGSVRGVSQDSALSAVRIDIRDAARCPRYGAALVTGVTVGPSPFWLRHRLHVLGLRAISNVVDVTNYVLLLWGHPIHAFDYDRVRGSRIEVRLAAAGERMQTLDGVDRTLSGDDLLICDGEGPVALAGVMGGANSEIAEQTARVLIECAYFDPRSVRRTSKRTGLHTDSSHRFERGVDPGDTRSVLAHATALIAELGGGIAIDDALDVVAQAIEPRRIRLRSARVHAVLGTALPAERSLHLLRALGCDATADEAGFDVVAPTHRPDIAREIDLVEELARLFGYDTLPTQLPRVVPSTEGTPDLVRLLRRLRETAAAAGLNEAINYAFVSPNDLRAARAPVDAVRVVNPMSEERSVMRTSLLPGLAANLRHAQRQQHKTFAQFELARVFQRHRGQALPDEQHQLGLLLCGSRREWFRESDSYDFYDGKAALDAIVRPMCGRSVETRMNGAEDAAALDVGAPELHPRRRARVFLGQEAVGIVGELHPDTVRALELEGRPVWALLHVSALSEAIGKSDRPSISALPRFPSATRDLAVVVGEAVPAGEVGEALRDAGGPLCEAVALFDIYRGEPVAAGCKSLAFHLVYRDPETTLTDKVVDDLHAKVSRAAEQRFGGSVRQ